MRDAFVVAFPEDLPMCANVGPCAKCVVMQMRGCVVACDCACWHVCVFVCDCACTCVCVQF